MRIDIPDDLAATAFEFLAQPDHNSLTAYVRALLRHEVDGVSRSVRFTQDFGVYQKGDLATLATMACRRLVVVHQVAVYEKSSS